MGRSYPPRSHPAENHADAVQVVQAPPPHFVSKWLMPPMLRRFVTGSSAPVARAPTPTIRLVAGAAAALDDPIADFVSAPVALLVSLKSGRSCDVVTPAEIAIAWIIARPSVTAPIASATSLDQLRTLLTATRVRLDRDTIAALDAASA